MKKRIALLLALALVIALVLPAAATVDTSQTTPLDISYTVATSFTISIPAEGITLTATDKTAVVGITAGSVIEPGKQLDISISNSLYYSSGFRMANAINSDIYLAYTISTTGNDEILQDEIFLSVAADACFTGSTKVLTFTPAAAQQAGVYSDTITFKAVVSTPSGT